MDYWALRRTGAEHHAAFTRIIAFKTLEWAVLSSVVAVLGALVLAGIGAEVKTQVALGWVIVVPLCFVAGRWVTSPRRVERFTKSSGVGRARRLVSDTIASVVIVRQILGGPRANLEAIGGSVLYWFGDILTLWAGLRAFDVHLEPIALVLGYATGYVVTMLPLPAGGVGGVR